METLFGIVPDETLPSGTYKTIFDPGIARKLIRRGCVLYDIKPHRDNASKTIFVFEVSAHFERCLKELWQKGGDRSGNED